MKQPFGGQPRFEREERVPAPLLPGEIADALKTKGAREKFDDLMGSVVVMRGPDYNRGMDAFFRYNDVIAQAPRIAAYLRGGPGAPSRDGLLDGLSSLWAAHLEEMISTVSREAVGREERDAPRRGS